jgi:hypothetical protein
VDVLNDDVLGSVGHPQALTTKNTFSTNTDDRLVRTDSQSRHTGFVVRDRYRLATCASIAVGAPVSVVDRILTSVSGTLVGCWAATGLSCSAFGALEVESVFQSDNKIPNSSPLTWKDLLLVKDDAASSGVCQPRLQLRNTVRNLANCTSTSSRALAKSLGCADDGVRCALANSDGGNRGCGPEKRKERALHLES